MKRTAIILIRILAIVLVAVICGICRNENEVGSVTVYSDGTEIEAYASWDNSINNGIAADALQIMLRDIESNLEIVKYAEDFMISIKGRPLRASYAVYTEGFGMYKNSSWLKDELEIPTEPGTYIIRLQAVWGKLGENTTNDYVFKLLIE